MMLSTCQPSLSNKDSRQVEAGSKRGACSKVDKENQPKRENQPGGENPREGVDNDDPIHEVGNQTFLSEQCDIGTQTANSEHCTVMSPYAMTQKFHSVPLVCCIPVES